MLATSFLKTVTPVSPNRNLCRPPASPAARRGPFPGLSLGSSVCPAPRGSLGRTLVALSSSVSGHCGYIIRPNISRTKKNIRHVLAAVGEAVDRTP